jgi:hypothetical protein
MAFHRVIYITFNFVLIPETRSEYFRCLIIIPIERYNTYFDLCLRGNFR